MRISIGILAWNEAGSIAMTIGSIFGQSLLSRHHDPVTAIEVVVLANGCTDDTVAVARAALDEHRAACPLEYVTTQACELPGPDRPGTWNEFIHRLSDRRADYIVMMDADICFRDQDTVWNLVAGLAEDSHAHASSSQGIKDVATNSHKSLFDRMCLAMTDMIRRAAAPRAYLTGGCYCGRAAFWRRIELPEGMKGDDSFLSRMVTTSLLTGEPDHSRIIQPANATFVFEAYGSPWILFKQHRRRRIGRYIESLIYEDVGREVDQTGCDAGQILRLRNRRDPQWLVKLTRQRVLESGWCMAPVRRILLGRLRQLRYQSLPRAVLRVPLAMLGGVWDLLVILSATRVMKRNRMAGVWFDTQNKRLLAAQQVAEASKPVDHQREAEAAR